MMKKRKKNIITMIFLLLVLVALIVAYVFLSKKDNKDENTDDSTTQEEISLATLETDKVNSIRLINEDADITFSLKDGNWVSEEDPNRPIRQNYVKNILSKFNEVKAIRTANENPEDLKEYGLGEERIFIEATQEDGTKITIRIGDEAVISNGYYALVNDDPKVYILALSYKTTFDYEDIEFTEFEKAPSITSENISYIEVLKEDGKEFELVFDKDKKYDKVGLFSWYLLKPYSQPHAADSDKLSTLLKAFSNLSYNSCIDYNSKDLSEYGLDSPSVIINVKYIDEITETLEEPIVNKETGVTENTKTYKVDREYKVLVGNQDENGYYFVKTDSDNAVYTMAENMVKGMTDIDSFNYISKFVSIHSIDYIDKIDINIDGTPYNMEIQREQVKNEEGVEEAEATYYYNGNVIEEDDFKDLYQSIISAKYDAEPKKGTEASSKKPVISIGYHYYEEDKTITTSYIPYDDSFYLVKSNGEITFLADRRLINGLFENISSYQQPAE